MTDQLPFADAEAEEGQSAAEQARAGIRVRLGSLLGRDDPVLGALVAATSLTTIARGVFLTALVLYLTLVAGLGPEEIALSLTVAAVVGIGASYLGGWLSDRTSARRLTVVAQLAEGVALMAYVFVDSLSLAIVVGCLTFFTQSIAQSARSAIIARGFVGPKRVRARAVLRTVTNVGIALGSGAAAVPIVIGSPEAYRIAVFAAGLLFFVSTFLLFRLPASVDAGRAGSAESAAMKPAKGRSPWRDRRYLAFVGLSAIFGIQFPILDYAMPLWIAHNTEAPSVLVSVLLIQNCLFVTIFTVPLSRGTEDPLRAGRVFAIAGGLMAVACVVYALAEGAPVWLAITVLVVGALAHAFAEVLSQAAGWGMSFELADPHSVGEYQGLVGMGWGVITAIGPPILAFTALQFGLLGWIALGVMFAGSAFGVLLIGRSAARTWQPA
jgi:Na+/melibiose symporter-like transporter